MTTRRRRAQIAKVMRHVFGVSGLRPGQQAVIDAVMAKQHTLAIMPTGAGKSLCYQVPAMLMSIGVQGKRCMWRALQNLRTPGGMDFVELEAKAIRQWEAIEDRRRDLVARTFSATAPRTE